MSVMGQHSDLGSLVERGRASFAARARWNVLEVAFWLAALASVFLLPSKHLILTEIAILALFALSLDLILGYAGIVSLGHAHLATARENSPCGRQISTTIMMM